MIWHYGVIIAKLQSFAYSVISLGRITALRGI